MQGYNKTKIEYRHVIADVII